MITFKLSNGEQIPALGIGTFHISDNFNIFDFTLTDSDMAEIAKINKNVKYYNPTLEQEENYINMVPDMDGQK